MSIRTLSYHTFAIELDWLFETVGDHIDNLGWIIAAHHPPVPKIPKRVGNVVVPYYFAVHLKVIFDFARGEQEAGVDFVREACDHIGQLLFSTAADCALKRRVQPDWSFLRQRTLGVVMLAAVGRAKLLNGEWLSPDEVWALTGWSLERATRRGLETRNGANDSIEFAPEPVAELLRSLESKDAEEP